MKNKNKALKKHYLKSIKTDVLKQSSFRYEEAISDHFEC
jgi:replication initiation and membrane attachment protein DnaB